MPTTNFVYPVAAELIEIQPDLEARAEADRLGLKLFPTKKRKTIDVRWAQRDNMYGAMKFRGLDGAPGKVQALGTNIYHYEAGVFGEHLLITEREYSTRAQVLNPTERIDITDLVMEKNQQLVDREATRKELDAWTLLQTGTISIPNQGPTGIITYTDSYTIQTFTASVPWSTTASATPILNLQQIQQLWVGHSVNFGAGSTLYVNQVTANRLLNNTNTADFGGRRDQFGATINNIKMANNYFASQNLPSIEVYDQGYQLIPLNGPNATPNTYNFNKFIPDGVGILIGQRPPGESVGEYQVTYNAVAGGSDSYAFVKDSFNGTNAAKEVPGKLEVHRGFNGGLAIFYPYAVVACTLG